MLTLNPELNLSQIESQKLNSVKKRIRQSRKAICFKCKLRVLFNQYNRPQQQSAVWCLRSCDRQSEENDLEKLPVFIAQKRFQELAGGLNQSCKLAELSLLRRLAQQSIEL